MAGGRLLTHAVHVITSNTSSSTAHTGATCLAHPCRFPNLPDRRIPAASRMAATHSAANDPGSPDPGPRPGPAGRKGATRAGTQFVCNFTVTVTGVADGHVIIDGVMVRIVLGGRDPDPASVTVPVTPGLHVISSVYVAVSPGSTVIVSPVPPDAGGGTVSVNPGPPPASDTVCGLPAALSKIFTVALSGWTANGVNVTAMVQKLPAVTCPPSPEQVVPSANVKSAMFGPVMVMLLKVSVAVPELVTVTLSVLLIPTGTTPNVRAVGISVTAGAVPVPESATVFGLPGRSLPAMFSVALRAPVAPGAKVMATVQLAPPTSV